MFKAMSLLLLAGFFAGCASAPEPEPAKGDAVQPGGCYQSGWQQESAPVIYKRLGADGLEKYDPESQAKARGCP